MKSIYDVNNIREHRPVGEAAVRWPSICPAFMMHYKVDLIPVHLYTVAVANNPAIFVTIYHANLSKPKGLF